VVLKGSDCGREGREILRKVVFIVSLGEDEKRGCRASRRCSLRRVSCMSCSALLSMNQFDDFGRLMLFWYIRIERACQREVFQRL